MADSKLLRYTVRGTIALVVVICVWNHPVSIILRDVYLGG